MKYCFYIFLNIKLITSAMSAMSATNVTSATSANINPINIFQEAISHCRWKKVLHNILQGIDISIYNNKTFEEIMTAIYNICKDVQGIGMLATYDITAAICRHYNINIDKVYIVGKGPKRAIKLLNIKTKTHKINEDIKLRYANITDIINAFDASGFELNEQVKNSKNGDILESYICNWQKTR